MEHDRSSGKRRMSDATTAVMLAGGCLVFVIGILVAIMYPVFAKARDAARNSGCMSNLAECHQALMMYASDYDDRLPYSTVSAPLSLTSAKGKPSSLPIQGESFEISRGTHASGSWAASVDNHILTPRVLVCPADPSPVTGPFLSYFYKHAVHEAARKGLTTSDFSRPAEQIILYEAWSFHYGNSPIADGVAVNAAFVDGHVRRVEMQNVAPDGQPRYFNAVDPKAPAMSKPYWDPRYCYDMLK